MRILKNSLTWLSVVSVVLFFAVNLMAQDLNQQKQEIIRKVHEIDKRLANATPDEYEQLKKEREQLAEQLKDVNAKLMADADAMKKINAVRKAYNDGNNAYKLGQYKTAVEYYDKATSSDATFYQAYYGKGLALNKMRKYTAAIEAYKGCVAQNPAYANAYVEMGKIYNKLGQVDNAIKTYQSAVENNPGSYKAYYQLGAAYLDKKKNYNMAAQNFTKATQLNPDYDLAHYSLGVSLTELKRYDEALIALDKAIGVTKRRKWESPHYRKAVIYNKQGNFAKAKAAADEALKNKKNYAPAAYEAGKASKDLGRYNQAIAYFKIAQKDRQWKRTADYEIDLIVNRDKYGGN
ncbi:MAG: tetratricopeptide repeat protein [bacterium]